ncbi:hypothetical protein LUZ60_012856 [Juncus effusus]|nr:hypothetical protein LUZ60_012856 [Juncus effusus]
MQLSLVFPSIVNPTSFKFFAPVNHKGVLKTGFCSNLCCGVRLRNLGHKKMNKANKAAALDEEGDSLTGSYSSSDSSNHSSVHSFESTLNKLSKWLVAGIFGLVILWKHDAEVLWAAMGSVVNSWLSISLKRILNHARPSGLRSDPGMPSSHAQSIFYASFFVVLSVIHWLGVNIFTLMLGAAILALGSYFSWLRVSQQLHTTNQVLVGAVLGSAMAIIWFWLWHTFVFNAFISSIWVRVVLVLGSVSFCGAFVIYVIKNWLTDER